MSWDDPKTMSYVVINDEEQYSVWPAYKEIPQGWRAIGDKATREDCLSKVEELWTDMRPKSLRVYMEEQERARKAAAPSD